MLKTWCEGKSIALEIEEHKPVESNRLREKFYVEVKNKFVVTTLASCEFYGGPQGTCCKLKNVAANKIKLLQI